jgi:1-acyl-sn-glycerol-3-phosphate acyltransferase
MFPEGTRSKDGALLPFKDGAFELALAAGAPILPVVLTGTRDCMPKGSKWLGHARAVARALSPISTEGLGPSDRLALKARARSIIADGVDRLRADLGMPPAPPPVEVPGHASSAEPAAEPAAARPGRPS